MATHGPAVTLRGPNAVQHNFSLSGGFHIIRTARAEEVLGQWVIHQQMLPPVRIFGLHGFQRLERASTTLLFNCSLDDVGEDYVLLFSGLGLLMVKLVLSPPKCPIEVYYNYLDAYEELIQPPKGGPRSVSGGAADIGRVATRDEQIYRIVDDGAAVLRALPSLKLETNLHERGVSGATGVDAARTLARWRSNPSWYTKSNDGTQGSIRVGSGSVLPLRTEPRPLRQANLFVSAAAEALTSVIRRVPREGVGDALSVLLTWAHHRIVTVDTTMSMTEKAAWTYLRAGSFPSIAQRIATLLLALGDALHLPLPHSPVARARAPYYLEPPELIFQWYAVVQTLLSLGMPRSEVSDARTALRSPTGLCFRNYKAWADTRHHGVVGWRDNSLSPSRYQPDLVVQNEAGRHLIIDAKFRRSDEEQRIASSSSIRDVQAYMQEYSLNRAVILVPYVPNDVPAEDIRLEPYWIRTIPVAPDLDDSGLEGLSQLLQEVWHH